MNETLILFHGTDARLISLSETERCAYIEGCIKAIKHLWSIFKPYYVTQELVETVIKGNKAFVLQRKIEMYKEYIINHSDSVYWYNLYEKLSMLEANENGSQYYQYGDLYLTGDKNKARRYALSSFAGGEIGLIAYRLIQGAEILGWDSCNNDESLKKTIESIKSFAEAQVIPVVIPISDLDMDYLFYETGGSIKNDNKFLWTIMSVRYTKEYTLSLEKAIYIK